MSAVPVDDHVPLPRRALGAVSGTAATSLASLMLTVAVARRSDVGEFSLVAVALVVQVVWSGCMRVAFVENSILGLGDREVVARQVRRLLLCCLLAAVVATAAGLALGNPYLVLVGACLPGLGLLDHARGLHMSTLDVRRGLLLSVAWAAPSAAVCLVSLAVPVAPLALVAVWAVLGAGLGVVVTAAERRPLRPGWGQGPHHENRASGLFTVDYLLGSGGAASTTLLAGPVVGAAAIGALRGAGTLLGPVSLLATSARSLVLPLLVRSRDRAGGDVRAAGLATLVLCGTATPFLVLLSVMPDSWGTALLGSSFAVAGPVLPIMALEMLFGLAGSVPAAGHRSRAAGRRAVLVRLSIGLPRPVVVCVAGAVWGLTGVAWGMALISGVSMVAWWCSLVTLSRAPVSPSDPV